MNALFEHVATDQPLTIKADTWNHILDNARDNKRGRGALGTELGKFSLIPSIRVFIENGTGADLDEFAVVQVSDPAIMPILPVEASSGVADSRFDIQGRPLLQAVAVDSLTCAYAITCEPIADGKIGEAVMIGLTCVYLDVVSTSHRFADVAIGTQTLKTADTGRAIIVWKESGTGTKLAFVSVEQIPAGDSQAFVPASSDCKIQVNTCPTFDGDGFMIGITVEYQGWCGPVVNASWSGGVATITLADMVLAVGDSITLSNILPSGYNGTYTVTGVSGMDITVTIADDPGTYDGGGTASSPNLIWCVENPTGCCEDAATMEVYCCNPYKLIVPSVLYFKITNTTGDAVGLPASTLVPAWVEASGYPGGASPMLVTTTYNFLATGGDDDFEFSITLFAGCAYIPDNSNMQPAVQFLITAAIPLTLTVDADWPEKIETTGAFSVGGPTKIWACAAADRTWAPGATDAVTSVSFSDGTLIGSFDLSIGTSP